MGLMQGVLLTGAIVPNGVDCHKQEGPAAKRVTDSVPERMGSMPGVDRESDRDNAERRFGLEAAREKRLQDDAARAHRGQVDLAGKPAR